jgi:hypothetical protein
MGCVLSQQLETADHIAFSCVLTKFSQSCVRDIFGTQWNPYSFVDFFTIFLSLPKKAGKLVRLRFAA